MPKAKKLLLVLLKKKVMRILRNTSLYLVQRANTVKVAARVIRAAVVEKAAKVVAARAVVVVAQVRASVARVPIAAELTQVSASLGMENQVAVLLVVDRVQTALQQFE